MIEMTLSSRHRIRNSSPGGLRPSTLPLGHGGSPQYWLSHVDGEDTFCFFQTAETGNRTLNSGAKGSSANHYPRAPALVVYKWKSLLKLSKNWLWVTCILQIWAGYMGNIWSYRAHKARLLTSNVRFVINRSFWIFFLLLLNVFNNPPI